MFGKVVQEKLEFEIKVFFKEFSCDTHSSGPYLE